MRGWAGGWAFSAGSQDSETRENPHSVIFTVPASEPFWVRSCPFTSLLQLQTSYLWTRTWTIVPISQLTNALSRLYGIKT